MKDTENKLMAGKGKVGMGRGKENEENLYEQIESDF